MKLKQWVKLIPLSVVASSLCLCAYASSDLEAIMKARNLSEKDILAAAKTYQPSGRRDEYMVFSSGGQSGQVIVYGVPSMRIYNLNWYGHVRRGVSPLRQLNQGTHSGIVS